jgi:hypothetical protein
MPHGVLHNTLHVVHFSHCVQQTATWLLAPQHGQLMAALDLVLLPLLMHCIGNGSPSGGRMSLYLQLNKVNCEN